MEIPFFVGYTLASAARSREPTCGKKCNRQKMTAHFDSRLLVGVVTASGKDGVPTPCFGSVTLSPQSREERAGKAIEGKVQYGTVQRTPILRAVKTSQKLTAVSMNVTESQL